MKLSFLAILLGLAFGLPNIYGLIKPEAFRNLLRQFPRSKPIGVVLMLTATVWFLYYVSQEQVADFLTFKPILYALFVAVGVGTCWFVQDFLPVRGLAVLLLLLAKLMVDTARWIDTNWRLVIVTWAYLWVVAGMWLTISPWRLRNLIHWGTASPGRIRLLSGLRLAFGLFVVLLGLTAFRRAEAHAAEQRVSWWPAPMNSAVHPGRARATGPFLPGLEMGGQEGRSSGKYDGGRAVRLDLKRWKHAGKSWSFVAEQSETLS